MIEARMNNEEFISEMMQYSRYGALSQVFVIEAIRNYCERVLANPPPEKDDELQLISTVAWYGCASEIMNKLTERYEGKKDAKH